MAILSRVNIVPQQRFDLEDFLAHQSGLRTDSKLSTQAFKSISNYIMGGFSVSGIGLNAATIAMTGAAFIFPQNTSDFSYFVSSPSESDIVIPDSDLVDGVRNYVELSLTTQDGTPLTKALWDPNAASGAGAEFNQIVNTIKDLKVSAVVLTGGFSGSVDRIPVAIIDVNGSGVIKVILDRRNLYGRLGTPSDIYADYTWGTQLEPTYGLVLTGVTGTFTAGETITIGGETATVAVGGTTSISFREPTGTNFSNGSSVIGGDSGATGTVDTVLESFSGADKSLVNDKQEKDAIKSEIKALKGTTTWAAPTPASVSGNKNNILSTIAPVSTGARITWTGTQVKIKDDSNNPSNSDSVAAIRLFNSSKNLILTRQDDGQEVVTISLDAIPDTGILTLDQDGNSIAINWDDEASDIQTTWDGAASVAATITGSPAAKQIIITYDAAGAQVDVTTSSNTMTSSAVAVNEDISIKQGMASDGSISIADGEILYVDLPLPLADTNYSDSGSGATNYKVAARGSVSLDDSTYWLAYREGSKLIWRAIGELRSGETSEISDNIPKTFLDNVGFASESAPPSYSSDIRGVVSESLTSRLGVVTDALGDAQEDRSSFLRSDDEITWSGTELQFTANIVLEILNTKSGTATSHTITVANSPISIADGESIWVLVDRNLTSQTLVVKNSGTDAIPAQTQANKDVFVLFKRIDASGTAVLHLPLHKQALEPGQSVRLGASGSGAGAATSMTLVNNQTTSADVTDFIVDSSQYSAFKADLSIVRRHEDLTSEDTTFTTNASGLGLSNTLDALRLQNDGKIVISSPNTGYQLQRVDETGLLDSDFATNLGTGFSGSALTIEVQSDQKILVGGAFTILNGNTRNRLLRVNADGTDDSAFYTNLGTGVSGGVVRTIVEQPSDNKILVGGTFNNLNGNTRNRFFRLNSSGTEDTAFYTNLGTGFDNVVVSAVVQDDGKILVGGSFTALDGTTRNRLVRLNSDGTVDSTFYTNLGTGFDGGVQIVTLQEDGKILVGGDFNNFNGNARAKLVRLNSDGTEDTAFYTNLGTGFDAIVYGVTEQANNQILVSGNFTDFDGNTRVRLVRLNSDGTEDTAFYTALGTGFDSAAALMLVGESGAIYIAGQFTSFDGNSRAGLVKLFVEKELVEQRTLRGVYRPYSKNWKVGGEASFGDDSEVEFSMTATGQLQYTSSDLGGTLVTSELKYTIETI